MKQLSLLELKPTDPIPQIKEGNPNAFPEYSLEDFTNPPETPEALIALRKQTIPQLKAQMLRTHIEEAHLVGKFGADSSQMSGMQILEALNWLKTLATVEFRPGDRVEIIDSESKYYLERGRIEAIDDSGIKVSLRDGLTPYKMSRRYGKVYEPALLKPDQLLNETNYDKINGVNPVPPVHLTEFNGIHKDCGKFCWIDIPQHPLHERQGWLSKWENFEYIKVNGFTDGKLICWGCFHYSDVRIDMKTIRYRKKNRK